MGCTKSKQDIFTAAVHRPMTKLEQDACKDAITQLNYPAGLRAEIDRSNRAFPCRFWILDNSGSMSAGDGKRFVEEKSESSEQRKEGMVSCSRWAELVEAVKWVGNIAISTHAPTQFALLNANQGVSVVNCGLGDAEGEREQLQKLTATSPCGGTPLCAAIRRVVTSVRAQAPALRQSGQRAHVTIATDGQASDGDIAAALRPLEKLPVMVVVKLCTDEQPVCDYWNNIDSDLELDLDVRDDFAGEAAEIAAVNPWLTYGAPLHQVREWGSADKLLDMLDERAFSHDQMRQLVSLVLGEQVVASLPTIFTDEDVPAFMAALEEVQVEERRVWDPIAKERGVWFKAAGQQQRALADTGTLQGNPLHSSDSISKVASIPVAEAVLPMAAVVHP
jgi:hypothetical protein